MSPEEKLIQLLENDIGPDTMTELEELLAENPELKEDKELYQQIILAIRKEGESKLRTELDGYLQHHLEGAKEGKVVPMRKYIYYGSIAASLTLAVLFFYPQKDNNTKTPIDWEINGIPSHADSATLETDSLKQDLDSLKKNEK